MNLMVPETKRLEFFSEFFERFYNDNFEDNQKQTSMTDIFISGYFFAYQYLFVNAVNMDNN